jgi:hypothetical protein
MGEAMRKNEKVLESRPAREYVSVEGASELTSLSPWTWRKWAYEGKVSSVKLGKRLLIPMSEIRRVVGEGTRPRFEQVVP